MIAKLLRPSYKNNEPFHCAVCNKKLPTRYITFLWYPMCDEHRLRAKGLHEWVQSLCQETEQMRTLELGNEVVRYMRLEEEQTR